MHRRLGMYLLDFNPGENSLIEFPTQDDRKNV